MWDMRYNAIYGYVICYKGKAKKSFRSYAEAQKYLKSKKEAKVARKSWLSIVKKNAAKGRKSQKRKKELAKNSVSATMKRVKSLLLKDAKGKKNGNTGYVGRIAKGKYIYRTKKTK